MVECAIYLAIVGGITEFQHVPRKWFVSWGVLGTITGSVFDYLMEKIFWMISRRSGVNNTAWCASVGLRWVGLSGPRQLVVSSLESSLS